MSLVGLLDREWIEPWDDLDIDWELEPAGPEAVLATIDMRGRGKVSGVPAEMRFFQLWTFRDGRAVRMEMFHDHDAARRAAGANDEAAGPMRSRISSATGSASGTIRRRTGGSRRPARAPCSRSSRRAAAGGPAGCRWR